MSAQPTDLPGATHRTTLVALPAPPVSPDPGTLAVHRAAVGALLALSTAYGHLPAPYITIGRIAPAVVNLQVQSMADFEAWRAALGVDPATVEMLHAPGNVWLAVETAAYRVPVRLTGFEVPLSVEVAAVAPADAVAVTA